MIMLPYKSNNIALQWITEKKLTYQAENGSDDAQYKLALEIISQEHLDNKQAIPWLKKAADSNISKLI